MIRFAFKYIHSKKITYFLVCFIGILVFVFGNAFFIYQSMMDSVFDRAQSIYGRFDCVLFGGDEKLVDAYRERPIVSKVGVIRNYGRYSSNGAHITIGSFDDDALDIFPISLSSGRFPENDHEIVLEDHYRLIDSDRFALGKTIDITDMKGKTRTLRITGFIESYTTYVNGSLNRIPGINDYPNGITGSSDKLEYNLITGIVIGGTSNRMVSPDESIISLYGEIARDRGKGQDVELVFNDRVYVDAVGMYIEPLRAHRRTDLTLSGIVVCIFLYLALKYYYEDFVDLSKRMYMSGASSLFVTGLFMMVGIILWTFGILFGGILSLLLYFMKLIPYSGILPRSGTMPCFYLLLAGIVLLVIVCASSRVWDDRNYFSRSDKRNGKSYSGKDSFLVSNVRKNILYFLPVILAAVILCSSFAVYRFEYREKRQLLGLDGDPWLSGSNYVTTYMNNFGDFEVYPEVETYNVADVDDLGRHNGVKSITKAYDILNTNLIIPGTDSDYLNYMASHNRYSNMEGVERNGFPYDIRCIDNYNYDLIIADDEMLDTICELNDINISLLAKEGSCIVFLPDIKESQGIKDDTDCYYFKGAQLTLARFRMKDGKSDIKDIGSFTYVSRDLHINSVIRHGMRTIGDDSMVYEADRVAVLISEDTYLATDLFDGLVSFTLHLDRNISREDYLAIKREFLNICHRIQFSVCEDYFERLAIEENIERTTSSSFVMLALTSVITLCSYTGLIILQSLYHRKREYGIMRSMGMNIGETVRMSSKEGLIYSLLFIIATIPSVLLFMSYYTRHHIGIFLSGRDVGMTVLIILLAAVIYYLLFMGCSIVVLKRYFRTSISQNIRYME